MSMDAELAGIYTRLHKLEKVTDARGFVLEAMLTILSVKFPEAYKGTVDGIEEGLQEMGLEFNDDILIQEVRRFLRVRPIQS